MSLPAPFLFVLAVIALGLPPAALAADPASAPAPAPNRRGADAAVVRGLQSNVWTLQSASDAVGTPIDGLIVPGHAFVMRFQDARVSIQGGCNTMNGSWRLSPQGRLMLGRLAATMKACETPLMKADTVLSGVLAQHLEVQLQPSGQPGGQPTLRLVSPSRQTLVFSGEPTLESLYGKATRIFLEVAAQTVPCQPGAGAPTQCLQVRERRFDTLGLPIEPPGAWRAFYGSIAGYTHTPGVRNVLRIDRYSRKQVPADASRYVYVLDMVVESESVTK
jgi:heat shock protein HslJ